MHKQICRAAQPVGKGSDQRRFDWVDCAFITGNWRYIPVIGLLLNVSQAGLSVVLKGLKIISSSILYFLHPCMQSCNFLFLHVRVHCVRLAPPVQVPSSLSQVLWESLPWCGARLSITSHMTMSSDLKSLKMLGVECQRSVLLAACNIYIPLMTQHLLLRSSTGLGCHTYEMASPYGSKASLIRHINQKVMCGKIPEYLCGVGVVARLQHVKLLVTRRQPIESSIVGSSDCSMKHPLASLELASVLLQDLPPEQDTIR